ncbi:olfactory receptor 142-like [Solea senegalensis]|uniref:Olfactory receptor 142-like n=1 Tax=Solea senegalensis TaxID=28829 RepID=A0AAV6PWA4_SOLSE|nr:olfactory receptor 142-like [Solea senegalensis]KAG7478958.1 olfactory receptor 142-like [Solea senegalensis]
MRRRMKILLNSSQVSHFSLAAYSDPGPVKYVIFLVVLCYFLLIIFANVLLIAVICMNRSLHEPMYLFLCSLFVNELYGSTGLFPALLHHIIADVHTISTFFCFMQIYTIHFYGSVEIFTLSVMSYDKYLAICHPLQYHRRMTAAKVGAFTAFVWLYSVLATVVMISLTLSLQLCGNTIDKVYCDNFSVVRLSCFDTRVNNVYGLVYMFTVIVSLIFLILFSYMRILRVCFNGCSQTRQKALSTCTPHLASLINFSFGAFFEIVQGRFDMSRVPTTVRVFLSLYWLIGQPFFNPLMHGLILTKIRVVCKSLTFRK